MSSTEPVDHDVTQLTDEEKATINEVMKVAQTLLETNNKGAIDIPLATVAGAMKNSQSRPIMLHKILDGSGVFVVKPPTNVGGSNDTGAFMHKAQGFPHVPVPGGGGPGPVIIGCKAAVIYGTFDNDLLQLGYLLAWFKAESSDEHKVYVEAGKLSKLMKMEWSDIVQKLDASSSKSSYLDHMYGAFASAEIMLLGDNLALLGASFNRVILRETTSES